MICQQIDQTNRVKLKYCRIKQLKKSSDGHGTSKTALLSKLRRYLQRGEREYAFRRFRFEQRAEEILNPHIGMSAGLSMRIGIPEYRDSVFRV